LIFLDEHDASWGPKLCFLAAIIVALAVATWILVGDVLGLPPWPGGGEIVADRLRRAVVLGCEVVYVGRLLFTLFVFVRRRLVWREALVITVLMPLALWGFAVAAAGTPTPFGGFEAAGLVLFVVGSIINTGSELGRHRFKARPQNAGRVYTGGLFRYATHVNYTGDILLFAGLAMVTGKPVLFVVPLAMALNFVFNIIPKLDRHLASKYGVEFEDYSRRTKKLVPFLY
jgi:steroid 5-alpha reductase family enzyme